jgi:hypothetical protein
MALLPPRAVSASSAIRARVPRIVSAESRNSRGRVEDDSPGHARSLTRDLGSDRRAER